MSTAIQASLRAVFASAIGHSVTLVVAEDHKHAREVFNAFVSLPEVQERLQHNAAKANQTNMEVDFWPAKPVRFFSKDSTLWSEESQCIRGYPPNTPIFFFTRKETLT